MEITTVHKTVNDLCNKKQHAKRFMYMKMSLEVIEPIYNINNCLESKSKRKDDLKNLLDLIDPSSIIKEKSFLRKHLRLWLNKKTNNMSNSKYYLKPKYGICYMPDGKRKKNDERRELPKSIIDCLTKMNVPWRPKSRKVTLTWIVCFLNEITPDVKKPNWDVFQCSHLCLGAGENLICLNPIHLCWELSGDNQSRGSRSMGRRICCVICNCGVFEEEHTICMCHKLHEPPCHEPLSYNLEDPCCETFILNK